jgi:hypothetical protein
LSGVALVFVRCLIILAGYACAALAASAALHVAWLGAAGFTPEEAPWLLAGSIGFSIPFVALFVAYFAFVPSAIAIGITELAGWRDWLVHALAGALVAGVVASLSWRFRAGELPPEGAAVTGADTLRYDDPAILAALLAAGLVGGIVYWAVAGRGAGSWRRRLPPTAGPSVPGPSGS